MAFSHGLSHDHAYGSVSTDLLPSGDQGKPYPAASYLLPGNVMHQPAGRPQRQDDERTDLAAVMSQLTPAALRELVATDPDSVHASGFNGLVPLHSAALVAGPEIIYALIELGADANACNNFGETPLQFASRRGNVAVMHALVEGGADPLTVDRGGHNAVHFAAQGGVVCSLHYLLTVCGMSSRPTDSKATPPLHVSLNYGRADAFHYLLRKQRSDMEATDPFGNTPLHIAAGRGEGHSCWRLLVTGAMTTLRWRNTAGQTPLDLAVASKSIDAPRAVKLLSYYTPRCAVPPQTPRGPVAAWYAHLLAPAFLYQMALLVSWLTPAPSVVVGVACVAMAGLFSRHMHRMNHACRWPNPVFAGMFMTGFVHTVACFLTKFLYNIYLDSPLCAAGSVVAVLAMCYSYALLLTRDPGVVKESSWKSDHSGHYSLLDISSGLINQQSFCANCELVLLAGSRHCRLCQRCYRHLDHHCLFLYRCVAERNQRLFVAFILSVTVAMVMFVGLVALRAPDDGAWPRSLAVGNAVSSLWTAYVVSQQVELLAYRATGRRMYWQRVVIFLRFLLTGRLRAGDALSSVVTT